MVLLKGKPSSLEDRQGLIEISLTTSSPTVSLSAPEDPINPFRIILTVRMAASSRPGTPITICTHGTVLDTSSAEKVGFDILALGAFNGLECISDDEHRDKKKISLGNWRPNIRHPNPSADMKERDWLTWLTIPPASSEASIQITHDLPLSRMLRYENTLGKDDLKPGESYRLRMNPGYVGTSWWCWGDWQHDLKDKKFSEWRRGWDGYNFGVEKPEPDVVEREGWVLGEDPAELWFEDRSPDGVSFTFVE